MKKFLCLLLTVLMLAPAMIACQNNEQPDDTSADSASDSQSDTGTTTPEEIKPDLPEITFDGETYAILAAAEAQKGNYLVEAEETEGNVLKQAIYDRNAVVEDQYDITLDYIIFNGYSAGVSTVSTALLDSISGSATYDLLVGVSQYLAPHIVSGYLADLKRPEYAYMDLTKPWYYKYVNDEYDIGGSQYLASSSLGLFTLNTLQVTFFNKQLLEDNNLEDPYTLVREHKWTMDTAFAMAEKAARDVNSDGLYSYEEDVVGIVTTWDYAAWLPLSFGHHYITKSDDTLVMTGVNDKLIDINETLYNLYNSTYFVDTYKLPSERSAGEWVPHLFANDPSLFVMHSLGVAGNDLVRDMGDYGIVPEPLYDEDQEVYYSPTVPDVLGVPSYVEDIEFSTIIAEALSYHSYKLVTPAYLENTMKEKLARDPDTAEMLDLIIPNATCDAAYLYLRIIGSDLMYQIGKSDNYSSWAASNYPTFELKLEEFMETIAELKASQGQ